MYGKIVVGKCMSDFGCALNVKPVCQNTPAASLPTVFLLWRQHY